MKLNKRAALELSFNFIFAMIAAVVVFSIALAVINSVTKAAQSEKSLNLINQLSDSFSENLLEGGKSDVIQLSSNILFTSSCDGIGFGEYLISTANYPLFSPNNIKTNTLGISTKKILMPNYISNSIYLYAPTKIYLYCEDCNELSKTPEIYFSLLRTVNSARLSSGKNIIEIEIIGSDFVLTNEELNILKKSNVLVLFLTEESNPQTLCSYFHCKSIKTKTLEDLENFNNLRNTELSDYPLGEITFEENNYPFLGNEMLFGALISNNITLYICNVEKILLGILRTAEINKKRLEIIEEELIEEPQLSNPDCSMIYQDSKEAYSDLSEILLSILSQLKNDIYPIDSDELMPILEKIALISELNYNATRYSCLSIY